MQGTDMSGPFNADVIEAKSAFALVGATLLAGLIFLANADVESAWGLAKGAIGISLCAAAVVGGRAYYRAL